MTNDAPDDEFLDDLDKELEGVLDDQDDLSVETVADDGDDDVGGFLGSGARDDPEHRDPADELAAAFESGEIDIELGDHTDREALEAFLERADVGDFGANDDALEATVRIARGLLDADRDDAPGI